MGTKVVIAGLTIQRYIEREKLKNTIADCSGNGDAKKTNVDAGGISSRDVCVSANANRSNAHYGTGERGFAFCGVKKILGSNAIAVSSVARVSIGG